MVRVDLVGSSRRIPFPHSSREKQNDSVPPAISDAGSAIRAFFKSEMSKSKRSGRWFMLTRAERSLYSLALNLRIKFTSLDLMRALVSILRRLREMGDGLYRILASGAKLAWAFSQAARKWGNESAKAWRSDPAYVEYLGRFYASSYG